MATLLELVKMSRQFEAGNQFNQMAVLQEGQPVKGLMQYKVRSQSHLKLKMVVTLNLL